MDTKTEGSQNVSGRPAAGKDDGGDKQCDKFGDRDESDLQQKNGERSEILQDNFTGKSNLRGLFYLGSKSQALRNLKGL